MNFLNYECFGFTTNPEDAIRIITETGIFYIVISISYLFSFLYIIRHSATIKKHKRIHYIGILFWGIAGSLILCKPTLFSLFFNFFIAILALLVLYQLQFTSALISQTALSQKISTDDKKVMYASTLLSKMQYSISDILEYTLINEQILWILIFFKAFVGIRASFGL